MAIDPITQAYLDSRPGPTFDEALADFVALKNDFSKEATPLTEASRDRLKPKSFAIPEGRKYPIEDASHARNALARVSQHGTPAEKAQVRDAVHERYPGIGKSAGVASRAIGRAGDLLGSLFGRGERFIGKAPMLEQMLPSGQILRQQAQGAMQAARGLHNIPLDPEEARRVIEGLGGKMRLDPTTGDIFASRLGRPEEGKLLRRSLFTRSEGSAGSFFGSAHPHPAQYRLNVQPSQIKGQFYEGGRIAGKPTEAQAAATKAQAAAAKPKNDVETLTEIAKRRGTQLGGLAKKHPFLTPLAVGGGAFEGARLLGGHGDGQPRRGSNVFVVGQ